MTENQPQTEEEAFAQQRPAMLTGPGGSLSMIAMPQIMSAPSALAGLPGTWSVPAGSDAVTLTAAAGDEALLDGEPVDGSVVGPQQQLRFSETVTAGVARAVDGSWFLQVADTRSPHLAAFAGLETYDVDPAWKVDARYLSRAEADRPTLAGRLGSDDQHARSSPGDVVLSLEGRDHSLATYASFAPGWATINFTDETSGSQTPSAGRIMGLPAGEDAPAVMDFNRAMILPHESSSVYPCPVPPAGNHLGVAVTAGERAVRFTR